MQTDKSVYKPSDNVQFRILVLDSETRPYPTKNMEVYITDGAGNRVKQFENIMFRHGVFQQELLLSDEPVLGVWLIHVKVDGDEQEVVKSFEVDKYILPTFKVDVITKQHISKEEDILVSYDAKYTYGKAVDGEVIVHAEVMDNWWFEPSPLKKFMKTLGNSTTTTKISLKDDLNIENIYYQRSILIVVSVTEKLTGKQLNGSTIVTVHQVPYKIEIKGSDDNIKPDIPFKLTIYVRDVNDMPISDSSVPIEVVITYTLDVFEEVDQRSTTAWWHFPQYKQITENATVFLKDGIAEMQLNNTSTNVSSISIQATYKQATGYHWISIFSSESNQYIDVRVANKNLSISKNVEIEVRSNVKLDHLIYVIFGQGKVISKRLQVPRTTFFKFFVMPSSEMIPSAKLIVYYITWKGEIISDRTLINFDGDLRNFVSIFIIYLRL